MLEPYKYKFYYALKGNEFDAIAKKIAAEEDKNAVKPQTASSQLRPGPRVACWIPKLPYNYEKIIDVPSPQAKTFSFKKAERKIVLLDTTSPNDKRFEFNPRGDEQELDPYDMTHYK